jgi:glycine cleavage system H protein
LEEDNMPTVRGCNLPDELLYDVENHVWFRELADGNIRIGMTAVAAALAGQIVAVTPRKVGRGVKAGRSCATIESGKWVGPAKSQVGGEIVEINQDVVSKPDTCNSDPYEAGWLVIVKPENWDEVKPGLVPGTEVSEPYEAKMDADGFQGCA